jgi:hypothetical protein
VLPGLAGAEHAILELLYLVFPVACPWLQAVSAVVLWRRLAVGSCSAELQPNLMISMYHIRGSVLPTPVLHQAVLLARCSPVVGFLGEPSIHRYVCAA